MNWRSRGITPSSIIIASSSTIARHLNLNHLLYLDHFFDFDDLFNLDDFHNLFLDLNDLLNFNLDGLNDLFLHFNHDFTFNLDSLNNLTLDDLFHLDGLNDPFRRLGDHAFDDDGLNDGLRPTTRNGECQHGGDHNCQTNSFHLKLQFESSATTSAAISGESVRTVARTIGFVNLSAPYLRCLPDPLYSRLDIDIPNRAVSSKIDRKSDPLFADRSLG